MIQTMNATAVRQNFFDLLVAARDKKQVTKVRLNGVVVAKIAPATSADFDWDKYEIEAAEAIKVLRKSNWDDVLEFRKKSKIRRYKGW